MMDFRIIALTVLFALCINVADEKELHRSKRNEQRTPIGASFFRGDVERAPHLHSPADRSAQFVEYTGFGSKYLPLRSAVESIPNVKESTRRLPLRDAVERRPPPDEAFDFEFELPEIYNSNRNKLQVPYAHASAQTVPFSIPEKYSSLFQGLSSDATYYNATEYLQALLSGRLQRNGRAVTWYSTQPIYWYYYPPQPQVSEKVYVETVTEIKTSLEKKVVCFVDGASGRRKDPLKFNADDVDPFTCTHVIYAFATIDPHSYRIIPRDEEYDVVQGGYRSVIGLKQKNPQLKVLLSVGEGRDQSSRRFSSLVSNALFRRDFIRSAVALIRKYEFDGIDLYWQYPGAMELGGRVTDKEFFALFVEELSEIFKPYNWLLTVSAPASRFRIEDGFNVEKLAQVVDFVNVETYDFQVDREAIADHHAPLNMRPQDSDLDVFNNVEYGVRYWLKKGLPPAKLIVGLPFYGRTFTLNQSSDFEIGSLIKGPGREGYYTQNPGFMAYFEICDLIINEGLIRKTDSSGSPYVVNGDQWIGYDDPESLQQKIIYIKEMNVGGLFLKSVDLDDFKGLCGKKWPLMSLIRQNYKGGKANNVASYVPTKPYGSCNSDGLYSDPRNCAHYYICRNGLSYHLSCAAHMLFDPTKGQCDYIEADMCRPGHSVHFPNTFREVSNFLRYKAAEEDKSPKVVCYLTNWSFYRKGEGKFVPEYLDQRLCTHIVYAFGSLDPEKFVIKEHDHWVDVENDLYERVTSIKDAKVLLSLGGWTDSAGDKYSKLVSDGSARRKFVANAVSFLRRHGFKGLHLDWNYPICWQSNCKKGPASDKPNFTKLLQELRREFDKESPPLMLAVGISGYKEVIEAAYELASIGKVTDFMSVMTYDYHGSWEKRTGHVSPLYHRSGDLYPQYNTNFTMEFLVANGAPREKLLVGVPFYGQTFTLAATDRKYSQGVPTVGPGEAGEYTKQPGMLSYFEICSRIKNGRWSVNQDVDKTTGPYAYYGDQWVGYDDVESIQEKAKYIKSHGFGGAVAWTVDLDDFLNKCCQQTFPLLRSLNKGLGLIHDSTPAYGDCTKPPTPVTPSPPTMTTGFDTGAEVSPTTEHWGHHPSTKPPSTTAAWWESTTTSTTTTHRPPSTGTPPWWVPSTPKPTTTTTRKRTTTAWTPEVTSRPTPTTPEPEQETTEKCEAGTYRPHPTNCNAYYRCVLGEMIKEECAGNLHWNERTGNCDWPDAAACHVNKKTTTKPVKATTATPFTTTTPVTTTTKRPYTTKPPPDMHHCSTGEYFPHEQCSSFYVCVNGHLVTQKCGPGLYWNTESATCDWSYRVRCTKKVPQVTQKLVVDPTSTNAQQPYSPCKASSFAAYPGDCSHYLICLWNKYEVFKCSEGLHWNSDRNTCDWPENAHCTEGGDTDTEGGDEHHELPPLPTQTPTTTTTTEAAPIVTEPMEPISGHYKIVCYFTNWAWYRKGVGKYVPEDIDPNLCTHIIYGFAVLDYENLVVRAHDSWADFDNKFYERVVAYKKKGIKVLLALGGWNDSLGDKYSRLVNNPAARQRFIKHVMEFLAKYDFDGLDLDWEYPKCWQVDCKKGPDSDKAAFGAFVKELKEAFIPKGYLLSAAVSPNKIVIDAGYDVPVVSKYLDWIAVMTYDYHGQWDKKTGHVAPFYEHPEADVNYFNANYSIHYWIAQGADRRKLILGMPLYGQSFQLENSANTGLNAKAPGPGQSGEFTGAAGFLAYYEICDNIKNKGWTVVQDPYRAMGPYAYKGNQWVSFDDEDIIRRKSEYIKAMNLGGGMIWALDLDDFKNRCGGGRHPLLSVIRNVLASPGGEYSTETITKVPDAAFTKPSPALPSSVEPLPFPSAPPQSTSTATPLVDTDSEFKMVCYFTNWAWYRQGVGKYLPSDIDPDLCTHIIYGFAVLDGDQLIIKPHDSWADFDNKFYEKVTAFKGKGIKVLIAIGGWNDSAGDKYSKLVNNPSARRRFIAHVVDFIEKNNFDGLDLDWEYPKCWQVDCTKGPEADKQAFADFVTELHAALRPKGLLLSAAVSPNRKVVDAGYDVPTLSRYLDWIAIMTYDYHGQWDKITGIAAPMYAHPEDEDVTFNTNFSVNYWINQGADRKKLVMGLPLYGQSFSLADNSNHGLNAPTYGGGEAGEETRARGFLSYYEICTNIIKKGWNVVRDKKFRIGPYAYLRDQWVSFDDAAMLRYKSEYIRNMGLGGGMVWALDLDDFKNICGCENYPLLRTINRVLRNYKVPDPQCQLGVDQPPSPATSSPKPTESWQTPKPQPPWQTEKPHTEKPTSRPPPTTSLPCDGRLFVPHKYNCNQYYLCNQGHLMVQNCPTGLFWNEDHCDWPENTKCHPDATTTEVSLSSPVIEQTTPRPYKPGTVDDTFDGTYKVVCYFTNWAWYRQDAGKYLPEDIDPRLCTHIAYGFAVLDPNTLTIKPHDSWADIDNEFYARVVKLKSRGIKILIALGGWNDSLGSKYSHLVNDPNARSKFVDHVLGFIEEYGFDGLDLDWEYPKCWQVDCNKGPQSDKQGFAALVTELSFAFKQKGLLLSAAVSPSKTVIDAGYDVPILSQYLDWIALMTYDYHGHWDKQTGHVAPLDYYPGDAYDYFNANYSVNYWIEMGASPSKLILGVPFYGQSFSLADATRNGLNEKSYGPGEAGDYTRAGGFLAFYEVCERVKRRSWTVTRDPLGRIGPYAFSGNQWVSYDDIAEIRRKSRFIKDHNLGGGMLWALDLDDFKNTCGCGKYPLLTTLNNELRGVPMEIDVENCT
ncbi:hypothetical protein PPYR_11834 [Photinus pyralis]|uniref:chitinase n=5 Tax=Photinus pyralis TaxID=7054 RepID=A0A5N4ACE3_PHOPY|nr:probable chitinase 10 [Photinus pyralis]KAB0794995.1 hypothetical protein PPYR_11834 [Photinus pyralis]